MKPGRSSVASISIRPGSSWRTRTASRSLVGPPDADCNTGRGAAASTSTWAGRGGAPARPPPPRRAAGRRLQHGPRVGRFDEHLAAERVLLAAPPDRNAGVESAEEQPLHGPGTVFAPEAEDRRLHLRVVNDPGSRKRFRVPQ